MNDLENHTLEKDKELERIKEKKLRKFIKELEEQLVSGKVVHVTDSNFNEIISGNKLVLVDFWAEWCMPCRMLSPIIEDLAKEYGGRVLVGKLNVDENPATASRFNVSSIPTLVLMRNGVEVERIVGYVPKSQIEFHFRKYLE